MRTDPFAPADVSLDAWTMLVDACDSPVIEEAIEAHDAAMPHSLLALACIRQVGTFPPDDPRYHAKNIFSLHGTGSFPGLLGFDSWADGIAAWVERLDDLEEGCSDLLYMALSDAMADIVEVIV